tara:strand:+ start:864 stop:1634 length:771 start_codon:yes stop_codon:yes gene_type:complete
MSSFEEATASSSSSSQVSHAWPSFSRGDFEYASCYCEENCYKLIERLLSAPLSIDYEIYCIFISTDSSKTPLFCQQAAQTEEGFVMWDYHVIVFLSKKDRNDDDDVGFVLDLDTTIQPFPCPISLYCNRTLRPELPLKAEYQRLYRVVPGRTYLNSFSSDRSHMKESNTLAPPWPCIVGIEAKDDNTIDSYRYITLKEESSSRLVELFENGNRSGGSGRGRVTSLVGEEEFGVVLREVDFLRWIGIDGCNSQDMLQ